MTLWTTDLECHCRRQKERCWDHPHRFEPPTPGYRGDIRCQPHGHHGLRLPPHGDHPRDSYLYDDCPGCAVLRAHA